MSDYAQTMNFEKYTEVCFYIEYPKVIEIGDKMKAIRLWLLPKKLRSYARMLI